MCLWCVLVCLCVFVCVLERVFFVKGMSFLPLVRLGLLTSHSQEDPPVVSCWRWTPESRAAHAFSNVQVRNSDLTAPSPPPVPEE